MRIARELSDIRALVSAGRGLVRERVLAEVTLADGSTLPIVGLVIGSEDRSLPTLGLFGGVHGLERIGTRVVLTYLHSRLERFAWDHHARKRLEQCRIVAIPLVNPGGMQQGTRATPTGVDIMRNAPVEALESVVPLAGGQRWSRRLPFFRGPVGAAMEPETQTLVDFVESEVFEAEAALCMDFHSGFGLRDRLWYPYAKVRNAFPRRREAVSLGYLLERTYPHHRYLVEPQSDNYTTHGDVWDYLFDRHVERFGLTGPVFLPWTLELGSWSWVRKNPRSLFTLAGPFNPTLPRLLKRVMRRHHLLVDFFLSAVHNHASWT